MPAPTVVGARHFGNSLSGRAMFAADLGAMATAEWRVVGLASIGRVFADGANALTPGRLAHCADPGRRAPGCAMLERKATELRDLAKRSFARCRETATLLDVGRPWVTLCGSATPPGRRVLIIAPVSE